MDRIKKPQGLIRYSSQVALESGKKAAWLRPRVIIYALVFVGLVSSLFWLGSGQKPAEITILRGLGAPFSVSGNEVVNQLRLKVQSRSEAPSTFAVEVSGLPEARLVAPELPLTVPASEQAVANFFVILPRAALHGSRRVELRVGSGESWQVVSYTLLGPEGDMNP